MSNDRCNKSIHCTVEQCANHCPTASYCALDSITVGTHEANPTMDQCTDCKSFQRKCCWFPLAMQKKEPDLSDSFFECTYNN